MIRISQLRLGIEDNTQKLIKKASKVLNIKTDSIKEISIFKESIDARKKGQIEFVYTVDVSVDNEKRILKKIRNKNVTITPDMEYKYPEPGNIKLGSRPIVIGMGPAGLFCGLILAQMGYKPLILERGEDVENRSKTVGKFWKSGKLNTESNVQFGEGGAGTFSDGKLTTRVKDLRCRKVLRELVKAGAPEDIMYSFKPHVGTDILKSVVKSLREEILELGGQVRFNSKATSLIIKDGKISGVEVNGEEIINSEAVVLAIGHSARDTFEMLHQNSVDIVQKPFAIGVRIEHPQSVINQAQYKQFATHERLGAADYRLTYHASNGRSVYTFCMCPGGSVVAAASEDGRVVTNGMSEYARDKANANSALLVSVVPEDFEGDHPLAGMYFQRKWEEKAYKLGGGGHIAPAQLVGDFLEDRASEGLGEVNPSYEPGIKLTNMVECLPSYVIEAMKEAIVNMDRKLKGFGMDSAIITGVETRSSSPIRILRESKSLESSNINGLYPAGEGAGYAGGIISAAVDGIKIAEKIILKYKGL
ncbi:NAD(P)/FAD-dependent oxidoreductase [Wukongibacter sp. M2B1]|uniref:NAD(P)/FAD-dependent oxidoreductase n=1 Tax=Wukongibacter sp. M2B1 TaxID=3088895 RepID=UPI003D7B0805